MPVIEVEGCEVVKDVAPIPVAGPGITASHTGGVSLEEIKKLIHKEVKGDPNSASGTTVTDALAQVCAAAADSHHLLGWVEQLEEAAHLIKHKESKIYSSILKSIRNHINHPFLGEFCFKLLGSREDNKVTTAEAA